METFLENPNYAEKKATIKALAKMARDVNAERVTLIKHLENNGFRYFANKLRSGYYEQVEETDDDQQPDGAND